MKKLRILGALAIVLFVLNPIFADIPEFMNFFYPNIDYHAKS